MRLRKHFVFIGLIALTLLSFIFESPTPYKFPELKYFPKMPQSPENMVSVEGAELGRYLFYDPILSSDNSMSCSGCHKQEFAFSDAPNTFSKGLNGTLMSRNTLPLFNLAWYPSFFWDGRALSIEEQVLHPVREKNELNLNWNEAAKRIRKNKSYTIKFKNVFGNVPIDSTLIAKAIGQFLRTLVSCDSKYDRVLRREDKFNKDELEGFEIVNDMTRASCLHCHTTDANALGTTATFSNNGLDSVGDINNFKDKGLGLITKNKNDYGKFKIPSLRNVFLTAPYMHDGRFKTIEEVIDFYSEGVRKSPTIDSKMEFVHKGGSRLNVYEKRKIIAFLKTLTDSTFISNSEFSNPFTNKN